MNLNNAKKVTGELRQAQAVMRLLGLDQPKSALDFDWQAWLRADARQQQQAADAMERFLRHETLRQQPTEISLNIHIDKKPAA